MDRLQNMRVFLDVVEAGSFTAAARNAQLSTARTSRAVAKLETQLRTRLLDRTTRRVALTDAGERYLQRCQQVLACVEDAEAEARDACAPPKGKLRVHAMTSIGVSYILPIIRDYQHRYPEVMVDLTLAPRIPDMMGEGYDVSIILSDRVPESGLGSQLLGRAFSVVCASPAYLAKYGVPGTPADLTNHICLRMRAVESPQGQWTLDGPRGVETVALPPASLQVNHVGGMAAAVREGMGLAILPIYTLMDSLMSGDIVRVMPDYISHSTNVYALYPSRQHSDAKTRSWANFLHDHPLETLMPQLPSPSELTAA
ncbi:DNA-binding transcriptional LysR family regulator [Paraburkholderia sp. BL6669N2]|uniref:LysR family transcriptional regulator n=1 Tax=Paraburkholderia sp. BL6669N2 TaxID=1938807 RepID=UPI000E240DDA|nr:LysR family transcriptional regulator [Paraburkholderia sp. BL6669N2]REG52140.1 DNA-binding transcriptional LysR family regulator [Paraburkholderia sp. BL6669N2]